MPWSPLEIPSLGTDVILRGFCTNVTEYFGDHLGIPGFEHKRDLNGFCPRRDRTFQRVAKTSILLGRRDLYRSLPRIATVRISGTDGQFKLYSDVIFNGFGVK